MSNTQILAYKSAHPNEGCKVDCLSCVKCGDRFYCLKHFCHFTSEDDILCADYHHDRVKEVTDKTEAMRKIDAEEAEAEVRLRQNKKEAIQIEDRLMRHARECPLFKAIFDYFYRVFQYNTGMTDGRQVMRSHFTYCPACGNTFDDDT